VIFLVAVENFTSLSDDLVLSAPLDTPSIIQLKEDVDLLGQDQLQLFSPSHCQIIQEDKESTQETDQGQMPCSQGRVVNSDSEVMKLLKAPHITVPTMARTRGESCFVGNRFVIDYNRLSVGVGG